MFPGVLEDTDPWTSIKGRGRIPVDTQPSGLVVTPPGCLLWPRQRFLLLADFSWFGVVLFRQWGSVQFLENPCFCSGFGLYVVSHFCNGLVDVERGVAEGLAELEGPQPWSLALPWEALCLGAYLQVVSWGQQCPHVADLSRATRRGPATWASVQASEPVSAARWIPRGSTKGRELMRDVLSCPYRLLLGVMVKPLKRSLMTCIS